MSDERAATEVLGFILAFAIITAAIGMIYTSGFGGLENVKDDEQLQNVERAFEVLSANLESVRRYGTPSRSTEIQLRDGRLELQNTTSIVLTVSGISDQAPNISMRPLEYRSADEETYISYEGGAVFRRSEGQSIMLSDPGWLFSGERVVVSGVQTFRQDGPRALDTSGTVLVVGSSFSRIVDRISAGTDFTLNITVNSPRAGAWLRYFQREAPDGNQVGSGPNSITYQVTLQQLIVVRSNIGIVLSR